MQNLEFRTGVIKPVEVYKEAWEMMKGEFWMIFGITIVGMLVAGIIPIVIMGPMMCGIYMALLDKADGRPASFEKLFKGFDYFLPGFIVSLVVMLPLMIFIFVVYIPMIALSIAGPRMDPEQLWPLIIGMIIVEIFIGILMTILHSLLIFAFPLIVDRKLSGMQAIKLSARAVWANKAGIGGLFGIGIILCFAGYLLLCVGVYLALPLIIMATTVAYRKVFPGTASAHFDPPPPGVYQGL